MTETKPPSSDSPEDVLQFLETLDTYSQATPATSPAAVAPVGTPADTQSVLDFIDQITKSTPTTTTTSTEIDMKSDGQTNVPLKQERTAEQPEHQQQQAETQKQGGAWSWGGLLATASTAYKTAIDTSVKGALATVETVRTNEATKKFEERVRGIVNKEAIGKIGSDLKTLSLNTLTTVVNAVVPPISQYEIVEVWLSHDMVGYVGVESIVYSAFMKVMEQVEGGDIVVRRGNESKKRDSEDESKNLNVCEGFVTAVRLAKASIEENIKKNYKPSELDQKPMQMELQSQEIVKDIPTTICPVFMAIQPTKADPYALSSNQNETVSDPEQYLFYVIVLTDPTHNLTFKTFSQALPASWLDISHDENEWVETKMVSAIKLAVQTIAQDYVWHRMTASEEQQAEGDKTNIIS